jgi:RNA polymerase sigma-70 factor (ECF subfamily)
LVEDVAHRAQAAQPLVSAVADERLRIVAGLIRVTGDWDLAEDCFQDAAERALAHWPTDGVPDNPAAWLTTTAHRRALDVLRRRRTEAGKLREVARMAELDLPGPHPEADPYGDVYRDDRLRLIFTCCHPALPLTGRVALTLKTVAGLSTREVARAFLVSEATMGQRLLRTKSKIANAGIRFDVPEPHRLAERTQGVLAVVYLVFNEGYAATEDVVPSRHELAGEAVRLAEQLVKLLPADDEVQSLYALLLLQHARREARVDADGDLVPMEEQDRSRWDRPMVAAGMAALAAARTRIRPPGPYRWQAEIAARHATAPSAAETDWVGVVAGYDALLAIQPSPVAALNRDVAIGFRDGPEAGLVELAEIERADALRDYHLLPAVRADLLRRAGRNEGALIAYRDALALVRTAAERRFLERRMREVLGQG